MQLVSAPHQLPEAVAFLEDHARSLRFVLELFLHWEWMPASMAGMWRFGGLLHDGQLCAVVCHQVWSGWWGLVCRDEAAAVEAWTALTRIGQPRHLEGEAAQLEAIFERFPALRTRRQHPVRSVCLRRSTADCRFPRPEGFRQAGLLELPALQAYHSAMPGRAPSREEQRRLIQRGAIWVLEHQGEVVSLGQVSDTGSHGYVRDIWTFPAHRRQGFARSLMLGILLELQQHGQSACLCVAAGNQAGLGLYASMGFEPWGQRLSVSLTPLGGRRARGG